MDSAVGEPGVLVTKDTVAEAPPLALGVNVRVNDAVPPAGIVSGSEGPLSANTELLAEADVTVTLEPAAPSVAGRVMLVPTATLPKLKLPGLMEN
jgi:hypothetical protein